MEGAQPTGEALAAGAVEMLFHVPEAGGRVPDLVGRAGGARAKVVAVSDRVMAHLTSTVTPQGVVAVARFVDVALEALPVDPGVVPVLCAVRDPGNAGTVLRSADASGAGAVVFAGSSVDVYNPKAVRASAGSLFHLPVVREVTVEEAVAFFRGRGAGVLAAVAEGAESVYEVDLTGPTAVLFGNEAWGLPADVAALADRTVRIPIRGSAESLNLAAAAALFLFEAARQRAGPPSPGGPGTLVELVSGAAHDIRQPLTALKGFAATLAANWERLQDQERRELVSALSLDGERVAAVVKLIIDVARMEDGRFEPAPERGDLAEAGRWVAALFRRSRDYPEVVVGGAAEAFVDHDRVRSILLVLCDTARFWGEEGPIEVAVGDSGPGVTMEVARRGGGPEPEEAAAMFEVPRAGGRLGLRMARLVARALGGDLSGEAGDGIRFLLTLPL